MGPLTGVTTVGLLHLLPSVVTILLSVVVGVWILQFRRDVRGAELYLALIFVSGIAWQLQIAALVYTEQWDVARFLVSSEKFTGYVASFVWVVFVAEYTNSEFHRERWVQVLFGALLVSYVFVATTNPIHRLLFTDIVPVSDPFFHGTAVRGPVYWFYLSITYAFVVSGVYLLAKFFARTRRRSRVPTFMLSTAALAVGTFNLSSIAGLGPVSTFQYGGYGAFPFLVMSTIGVFKLGLLDIAPVARTTLVESLSDAVLVVDERGRIVDFNQQAVSLWPALENAEGQPFEQVCRELAETVDLGDGTERTDRITLTFDDESRHYSLHVSRVDSRAERVGPRGYALLLRDATELENSRRQLEDQNRRLESVGATVSHDLRNPLTVADGHLSLLESDLDDDDLREHVDAVDEAHDRMEEIIDDVLTLARESDAGLERTAIDVGTAAKAAWSNVETPNAELEVQASTIILADRSRLLTVFENLFRNATEHGVSADDDAGVTITVESLPDGFAVTDDGPGIPPDIRDDVFDIGVSAASDGTGYGLHIVERIVSAHGWTIAVTDGPTGGARFEITGVDHPA